MGSLERAVTLVVEEGAEPQPRTTADVTRCDIATSISATSNVSRVQKNLVRLVL